MKSTDELTKLLKKTEGKPEQPTRTELVLSWIKVNVWDSRPIKWLAISLVYVSIAYAAHELAKYYIGIPEFNGIVAFVATFAIGSRAFRKAK